jgi:hypothetical protein
MAVIPITIINIIKGQKFGHNSIKLLPFSIIPFEIRMKYVIGIQLPIACAHFGIPENGNINPDRIIDGSRQNITICIDYI